MYANYFGLTEKPFAIAPNPRYLYMSEQHREALAHLLYGINSEGCIVLLTGDVGTGKTTICRLLIEQLPETTDVAVILNPKLSITDLLKTLCTELKIPVEHQSPSVKTYIDRLNEFLLDAHAGGRTTALIIDEAQNLDKEVLEQLRLLTNLETNTQKLLQIVLIGQSELRDIFKLPGFAQINQRITTRYHLKPLKADDVFYYMQHRLSIAGGAGASTLFSKSSIRFIAKFSQGIPRLINLLCDHSLLGAYAGDRDHVDVGIAKKAARELTSESPRTYLSFKRIILAVGLLTLVLALPAVLYLSFNTEKFSFVQQFKTVIADPADTRPLINEPLSRVTENEQ